MNFKDAYAFAAIPSRYVLENKLWRDAARLTFHPASFPWQKFPWQMAILNFARVLGFVHINQIDSAKKESGKLRAIYESFIKQQDLYKATQVRIQLDAADAWILAAQDKDASALEKMNAAADLEDHSQKSPVTPGEVIPARELLGDMLLQMNKPAAALTAYEADLKRHPGRFNGLYGAAVAAATVKDLYKAGLYYRKLLVIADAPYSNRPELTRAKAFVSSPATQKKADQHPEVLIR